MKNHKGFTLVELLAAMAIIAILIGLSIFGIGIAQRTSRNAQRRSAVNDINLAVQSFYEQYGRYPAESEVVFTSCSANPTSSYIVFNNVNTEVIRVPLRGAAGCLSTNANDDSTSSSTVYRYKSASVPYTVCAKLEVATGSQTWQKEGIDAAGTCP